MGIFSRFKVQVPKQPRYIIQIIITNFMAMTNSKFEKAARLNKAKAVLLTIALHIVLIGGFAAYGNNSLTDLIPQKVKSFLGMDEHSGPSLEENKEVAIRP